ncbi:MAG: glycosyltransferase family 39 protein [Candidatus Omnitrophota bacterium]
MKGALNSGGGFRDKFAGIVNLLKTDSQRPKMVHFIDSAGDLIFGEKYSRIIVSSIYYLILILGAYFITKRFYGRKAGVLAATLAAFYPEIFHLSKTYELDFPLTAFFIYTFYLLISTDNFKSSVRSIFFGIFLGIGILIKGSILIFLITPILFYFYYVCRDYRISGNKSYKPILNAAAAIFLGIAVSSLWWQGSFSTVFLKFQLYLTDRVRALMSTPYLLPDEPAGFLNKISYNLFLFIAQIIKVSTPELFIFFIVTFTLFLKKRPKNNLLIFSLLAPLSILYFSRLKEARYFMPLLPLFAIVISAGLFEIANRKLRVITIALACLFAFGHFFSYLLNFCAFSNIKNRPADFQNYIYAKCSETSEKFIALMEKRNSRPVVVTFISETSNKDSDPMMVIKYFMEKQCAKDIVLDLGYNNLDKSNFIILLFDRKYFFKVASFLEEGRKSPDKKMYLDLCDEYLVSDKAFCRNLMDRGKFNKYLRNLKQKVYNKRARQLGFFERLLFLEAVKNGSLDIQEAARGNEELARKISYYSRIYNQRGIGGLIQDLTITYPEFRTWLETGVLNKPLVDDVRWGWLYKQLTVNKFAIIGHEEIQQLGIDFYLLEKEAGNHRGDG